MDPNLTRATKVIEFKAKISYTLLVLGNGTVEYNEFIRMMDRYSEKTAHSPDLELLEAFRVSTSNKNSTWVAPKLDGRAAIDNSRSCVRSRQYQCLKPVDTHAHTSREIPETKWKHL